MAGIKKTIIISGINFFEGGPLTIMTEALETLSLEFSKNFKIIALVNSKALYKIDNIEFIEFPSSRKSWLYRLYYEYFVFKKISNKIKPDYWLSMHDITPNVNCPRRYVYCHNPAPFFTPTRADFKYGFVTYLFSKFYKYLYRINIKKNDFIIVQQDWLRERFKQMFNIKNIIVAYPENKKDISKKVETLQSTIPLTLFYPSFPRSFKNFELICKAYSLLPEQYQHKLHIYITIDNTLNKYSRKIVGKYEKITGLQFLGLLTREDVFEYYNKVDGLIFPSRMETWGLPISEFKHYNKPIFSSDLPYAHETIGNYDKVKFFNPYSAKELTQFLMDFIDGTLEFDINYKKKIAQPFVKGWQSLFDKILYE